MGTFCPRCSHDLVVFFNTYTKCWGKIVFTFPSRIKDNNNSPHGKFHRFLFLFSSKFSDLNFASFVLFIYSCYVRDTQ